MKCDQCGAEMVQEECPKMENPCGPQCPEGWPRERAGLRRCRATYCPTCDPTQAPMSHIPPDCALGCRDLRALKARLEDAARRAQRADKAEEERDEARKEVGKLHVQLAGCAAAAQGATADPARPGDYGWSPAYQDVLNLRRGLDAMKAQFDRLAGILGVNSILSPVFLVSLVEDTEKTRGQTLPPAGFVLMRLADLRGEKP